jgi:nucleoside-diphosphate-sugar epimerase
MYHDLYDLPVVILRVFYSYGPGPQALRKIIPYSITSILRHESPRLSQGERPLDWVYIDDVADAFLAAIRQDSAIGHTIDVGTGTCVPIRSIVEQIVAIIDNGVEPVFGGMPDRLNEVLRVADTEDAARLLGWCARTPLEAGLTATIDWHRERCA